MSFAVDVNLLLYAHDARSKERPGAKVFVDRCLAGPELMCLGCPTVMGYLSMATPPRIFAQPLTHSVAAGNVQAMLGLPHVRTLSEGEHFWRHCRQLSDEVPTRANFVPDVHLAALLREHGVPTLYTHDRDFRKFDFLDVRDPLA